MSSTKDKASKVLAAIAASSLFLVVTGSVGCLSDAISVIKELVEIVQPSEPGTPSGGTEPTVPEDTKESSGFSIFSSCVRSYYQMGSDNPSVGLPSESEDDLITEKAFSILSVAQSDEETLVGAVRMDLLDIEPILEPIIRFDAAIENDVFYAFALNDGWGTSDEAIRLSVTRGSPSDVREEQQESVSLNRICKSADVIDEIELPAAGVCRIARMELDVADYLKWESIDSDSYQAYDPIFWISVVSSSNDVLYSWPIGYDKSGYLTVLHYDSGAHPVPTITLFAVLDVERGQKLIDFDSRQLPSFDGFLRIETAVAPTESCELKCRDVFSVKGEEFATEDYSVRVVVPCYEDELFGSASHNGGSKILAALMEDADANERRLEEIAKQFRWKPESLGEQYSSVGSDDSDGAYNASSATDVGEATTIETNAKPSTQEYASATRAYMSVIDDWKNCIAYEKADAGSNSTNMVGNWSYAVSPRFVSKDPQKYGDGFAYCYQAFDAFDVPMLVVADPEDDYKVYGLYQFISKEKTIASYTAHFRHHKYLCEDKCFKSWNNTAGSDEYCRFYWVERPTGYILVSNDHGESWSLEFTTIECFQYSATQEPGEFTDALGVTTTVSIDDGRKAIDDLHPAASDVEWHDLLSDFVPPK